MENEQSIKFLKLNITDGNMKCADLKHRIIN